MIPARLMAADPARFMLTMPAYLRGEPLGSTLILWPESQALCKYSHISWDGFIAAVAPAFETFRSLWNQGQTTTLEVFAPYVERAIAERRALQK